LEGGDRQQLAASEESEGTSGQETWLQAYQRLARYFSSGLVLYRRSDLV
jgi:hypothetical protein